MSEENKVEENVKKFDDDKEEFPEDKLYPYNGKMIKVNLIKHDMEKSNRGKCYDLAFDSLYKYTAEKEMSEYVKANLDREYDPEWQCVIGKDFSTAFSHEIENFIFFQIEDFYFLFFKL